MGFRWIALVALWTLISGPIFSERAPAPPAKANRPAAKRALKPKPKSYGSKAGTIRPAGGEL